VNRSLGSALATSIVAAALLTGCSGGPAPAGETGSPGGGGTQTAAPGGGDGGGGGLPAGHAASGAKVRVINTYVVPGATPGPIDVYAATWANDGDTPLVSVAYGQASDFFDPTVFDDGSGDAILSFYAAGITGNGKALITQTATLTGKEVITYYLTTGSQLDDGSWGGSIQVFFDRSTGDAGSVTTPPPGQALLTVVGTGLDHVLSDPEASSWYLSLGNGCEAGLGNGPGITVQVGPGQTAALFGVDPGQRTVTVHTASPTGGPDCSGAPVVTVPLDAAAGEAAVLFLYAPKDGDIRSLLVPLAP
jgi:hypothetical protein